MPLTLRPINRRRFLSTAAAAGAALALPTPLLAKSHKSDPDHFALLSDIHLHADKTTVHDSPAGPANMWANLQQACNELLASPSLPSAVLINGDIAFRQGSTEDYDTALAAMKPLREAGLTVHWALGNHDDRLNISKAALPDRALVPQVTGRRVMLVRSPRANLFLLDSLNETAKTPGLLGKPQLDWLAAALDRNPKQPAIVFVHHQPFLRNQGAADGTHLEDYIRSQKSLDTSDAGSPAHPKPKNGALLDTLPLLDILLPRKQVKMYFFGHSHQYSHKILDGLHLVNLPATAYMFTKGEPIGWMDLHLEKRGTRTHLHCLDPKHPLHNDQLDLRWRA